MSNEFKYKIGYLKNRLVVQQRLIAFSVPFCYYRSIHYELIFPLLKDGGIRFRSKEYPNYLHYAISITKNTGKIKHSNRNAYLVGVFA